MRSAKDASATPKPTATPTPAPTYTVPQSTVKNGSTGDDAKLVQSRLKELGYYTGKVDGKFGASSVKALEAFQQNNGLKVDGAAGSGHLCGVVQRNGPSCGRNAHAASHRYADPGPTATMAPITKNNVVTIKQGVTGQAVTYLQNRLTVLGYYQANADGTCKRRCSRLLRLSKRRTA